MSTAALERRPADLGAVSAVARMSPEQLKVVKDTVAKGASDAELAMFLELASRYQLDPFSKEIWCIKYGGASGPATIMTGRDGYLAIANRHPAYRGMASDVVREGDTFARKGVDVEHAYGAKRGVLIGAYALVYRSDRDLPAFFFAPFAEYSAGKGGNWKTYPTAMIVKVAEAMALKRAFSISGLVTDEEVGGRVADAGQKAPAGEAWPGRWEAVKAAAATANIDLDVLKARMKSDFGVERPSDLDDEAKYQAVMAELRGPEPADGDVVDGEVVDPETGEVTAAEDAPGEAPAAAPAEPEQQVIDEAWDNTKRRPEDPG